MTGTTATKPYESQPQSNEAKPNFDQTASPLKGIKNITTPSGVVMRVTDTDLKWFNHFYTFEAQDKKCYQSIKTIASEFGRAVSAAQERIAKLESLGLLTVGKEPFKGGERNTYICTPISTIISRITSEPVTPQNKKLKKSQLRSLLRKSEAVDALAINQGIKDMAKAIAGREISDAEVMQFAFQIAAEKLAVLGWNIETTAKEKGKSDEDAEPQAEQEQPQAPSVDPIAGMAPGITSHDIGQRDSVVSNEGNVGIDRLAGNNVVKTGPAAQNEDIDPPNDAPDSFKRPGETDYSENVKGETLSYEEICELAGAG